MAIKKLTEIAAVDNLLRAAKLLIVQNNDDTDDKNIKLPKGTDHIPHHQSLSDSKNGKSGTDLNQIIFT